MYKMEKKIKEGANLHVRWISSQWAVATQRGSEHAAAAGSRLAASGLVGLGPRACMREAVLCMREAGLASSIAVRRNLVPPRLASTACVR